MTEQTQAVRDLDGRWVEEPVNPFDQCQAEESDARGRHRCPNPWAYRVEISVSEEFRRGTDRLAHPSVRGWAGRELCWFHARIAQLHAERWDLPLRVSKMR